MIIFVRQRSTMYIRPHFIIITFEGCFTLVIYNKLHIVQCSHTLIVFYMFLKKAGTWTLISLSNKTSHNFKHARDLQRRKVFYERMCTTKKKMGLYWYTKGNCYKWNCIPWHISRSTHNGTKVVSKAKSFAIVL